MNTCYLKKPAYNRFLNTLCIRITCKYC